MIILVKKDSLFLMGKREMISGRKKNEKKFEKCLIFFGIRLDY